MSNKLSTGTPWGFTLEDAIEAFKFRQKVLSDDNAFNFYNPNRRSVPEEVFNGEFVCSYPNCTKLYIRNNERPKLGRNHDIVRNYCETHYIKLWNFRSKKEALLRQKRERDKELANREDKLKNIERYVNWLETKSQRSIISVARKEYKESKRLNKRYNGPPRKGYVYRLYDINNTLLYIGKTYNVDQRLHRREGSHERSKDWWSLVDEVDITVYRTEEDALKAESLAIKREDPIFNLSRPTPKVSTSPRRIAKYRGKVRTEPSYYWDG